METCDDTRKYRDMEPGLRRQHQRHRRWFFLNVRRLVHFEEVLTLAVEYELQKDMKCPLCPGGKQAWGSHLTSFGQYT